MTFKTKNIKCPNCDTTIKTMVKNSEYRASYNTDFGCLGACTKTPTCITCESCQYLFYDKEAIQDKKGNNVENANFTFLLTRPFTRDEDVKENNVSVKNGLYVTKAIALKKKGRYTLQVKVNLDGLTGYSEIPAYLAK